MILSIGKLDRQVTLQQLITTKATNGEKLERYEDVATVAASVKVRQGKEEFQAAQKTAVQEMTFTIRYRADVQATWRLLYDGQTYDITATAELGRRQGLQLTCFTRGKD